MQFILNKKNRRTSRGFTLVETLVAITILLIVIVGPMTIASRGMQSAYFASDQATATYLAQEGIEYIQKLRDNNALLNFQDYKVDSSDGDGDTWNWYTVIDASCKGVNGCDVDLTNGSYKNCAIGSSCLLNKYSGASSVSKTFAYTTGTGWASSQFTRRIRIGTPVAIPGITAVPVSVSVSWSSSLFSSGGGATVRTVTLQTYIYDHYSRFE